MNLNLLSNLTDFTDFRGRHMKLGMFVKNEQGKVYQVIQDPDFTVSIVDLKTKVVEKLYDDVAWVLEVISREEANDYMYKEGVFLE